MHSFSFWRDFTAVLFIVSALVGCSLDGSSSVQGLKMASTMSVVTAQDEGGGSLAPGFKTNFAGAAKALTAQTFPTDSDYLNDESHTYVWDESMQSLQTVNMILCLIEQTGASEMVNKGAYIALVNEDKCEQGKNQSSSSETGQSSGGQVEKLNKWIILSTRADDASPQYVKAWVPGGDGQDPMDQQRILVEVTITEGVSAAKPYGSFEMQFKGVIDFTQFGGSAEETVMLGTLRTVENAQGKSQFEFINLGGSLANSNMTDFAMVEKSNVILDDASGTGGVAKTRAGFDDGQGGGLQSNTYVLAFNASNVLRGLDVGNTGSLDTQTCLARDDFDTQAWRYNLYHRDSGVFEGRSVTVGQRVSRNSGFPFRYTAIDNSVIDGHASYWGLWLEDEQYRSEMDGRTISSRDYGSNNSTDYTVHIAPGKTIRRVATPRALSDFEGSEFYGHFDHPDATLNYPDQHGYNSWVVRVQSGNFVVTHGISWGSDGPTLTPITGVTQDTVIFSFDGESLWLWSDALGGNVVYNYHSNSALAKVTFYAEEFVYPSDSTLFPSGTTSVTLYCYDNCPKGGLDQTAVDAMSSPDELFYTTDYDNSDGTTFHQYTLAVESNKVILRDKNNNIVSTDGIDLSSLGFDWGLGSSEMVLDTTGYAGSGENPWEIYQAAVSYRWETGSDQWNKLVTVVDGSNNVYSFDRPLQFTFTVQTGDDANNDNNVGQTFRLDYGGPGELWGFPWKPQAGCDTATQDCRWYAAVTLNDGVELSDGTNTFVVRAIEKEQSMTEDAGACGALDVSSLVSDAALSLPTADSSTGNVSISFSGKPVPASDAPAIIEGELQ